MIWEQKWKLLSISALDQSNYEEKVSVKEGKSEGFTWGYKNWSIHFIEGVETQCWILENRIKIVNDRWDSMVDVKHNK